MNINRERSEKADLIVSRLPKPQFARTDLPVVLALQETRSSNTDDLLVPGFIENGTKVGLTTPRVRASESCTEIIVPSGEVRFGTSWKNFGHECVCSRCWQKSGRVRGVHGESAKNDRRKATWCQTRFYVVGDLNIELGLLCACDEESE